MSIARSTSPSSRPDAPRPGIDSVGHKLQREIVLLLAWGPAVLLQLAHPLVARGVADHSTFRRDSRGQVERFSRTVSAMLELCFGTEQQVEAVLARMTSTEGGATAAPPDAQPTDTYYTDTMKLSHFFNGEGVQLIHQPTAHTDGDTLVWFRGSDVIAAGDLYSTVTYPVIDVKQGGTIDGVVNGLNRILRLSIAEFRTEGGTLIVPGHDACEFTARQLNDERYHLESVDLVWKAELRRLDRLDPSFRG